MIEILIVIIIISILILLSYPRLVEVIDKSYDVNIKKIAGSFRNFMSMYIQDHNRYPESIYNYNQLKDDLLNEYGELSDITEIIKSDNYEVDNSSNPKTYTLKLVSSKTNKIYIITPTGFTVTQ